MTKDIRLTSIEDARYKKNKKVYKYALDMVIKELHQSVEAFFHNMNSLQSRSGNQLPFTSINFGTCTLPEGRMIIKALLDVCIEGLGSNGVTSIFPCGIFQIKSGVNKEPGTPNYDLKRLALESTTKRIYPNYANADWTSQKSWTELDRRQKQEHIDSLAEEDYNKLINILENNPELSKIIGIEVVEDKIRVINEERPVEIFSTMGCRTANGHDIHAIDNFKESIIDVLNGNYNVKYYSGSMKDGRGNICPVTIILPTLAMMARQKSEKNGTSVWDEFVKILDKKIDEGTQMLIERFNHIASQSYKSAKFMYENDTMSGYKPEEGIVSALKHGTLALGQIGLSEALHILFGYDHTTDEGMKYAKEIEGLFNRRCSENKKKYKLNIGVYYTPAESLCGTAMKNFKKAYPEFDEENVTFYIKDGERVEKTWFTNSMHVPVQYECDPFQKIDIESQLTGYSNAGCITYIEVGDVSHNNINGIETLVDYAMDHDIPYFALNIKISQCHNCGERIWDLAVGKCPKCGCDKIDQLGRVTGYLSTTVKNFNAAKQDEFKNRTNHFKS